MLAAPKDWMGKRMDGHNIGLWDIQYTSTEPQGKQHMTLFLPLLRPKKKCLARDSPTRELGVKRQPLHGEAPFLLGAQRSVPLANCNQQSCNFPYLLLILPVFISFLVLPQAVVV